MSPTPRVRWLGCLSVSLAGLLALAVTLTLPSAQGELHVAAPIRVAMACAGVVLLVVATRASPLGGVAGATTLLGVFVLAYPSLLGLAASRPLDPVAAMAGTVGHVPPLVLLQLIPVLAVTAAIGRRHRRWETAVLATAAASIACTAVSTAPVPASGTLGTAGTVLWFGSVVVAPIATWWSVRGTGGERRRRSVLAALAAMVPVVVIGWCLALGAWPRASGSARAGRSPCSCWGSPVGPCCAVCSPWAQSRTRRPCRAPACSSSCSMPCWVPSPSRSVA